MKSIFTILLTFLCAITFAAAKEQKLGPFNIDNMKDISFTGGGISFILKDKTIGNYCDLKNIKTYNISEDRKVSIAYGQSVTFSGRHIIFRIYATDSSEEFIIEKGFDAFSFGDGMACDYFLITKTVDGVKIEKAGEYSIRADEYRPRLKNGVVVDYNCTIYNRANNSFFRIMSVTGSDIELKFFKALKGEDFSENFFNFLSDYISNGNSQDMGITYLLRKDRFLTKKNVSVSTWNYLVSLQAFHDSSKEYEKYKLKAEERVQKKVDGLDSFPKDFDSVEKINEYAAKAFLEKYKDIAPPAKYICSILTLRNSVPMLAKEGVRVVQVEMCDKDNNLVCVAWINPNRKNKGDITEESIDKIGNLDVSKDLKTVFVLPPVHALAGK